MGKQDKNEHVLGFGNRLRMFREKANLSQDQIHYATGVTQTQISRIETANNNPRISTAYKLAEFFGQTYDLFLIGNSIPTSTELLKSINKYLVKHEINPDTFLRIGLTKILKAELREGKFFNAPRLTIEVTKFLKDKHKVSFSTSRVSDALEELKRKGLIEKIATDQKSKFRYKKSLT